MSLEKEKAARIAGSYVKPISSFSKETVFNASRKILCDNFYNERINQETFEKALNELDDLVYKSGLTPKESDVLIKGGEGSRGGHVIGHTRNGKPIYSSFEHHDFRGHSRFNNPDDHIDAANHHGYARNRERDKIIQEHGHDKAKVLEKLNASKEMDHHNEQRQKHLNAFGAAISKEKQYKEKTLEKVKGAASVKELDDIQTVVNHPSVGWSDEARRHINDHISLRYREIAK